MNMARQCAELRAWMPRRVPSLVPLLGAVIAPLCSPVAAQSVTLYGTADAGLTFSRSGAPGTGTVRGISSGTATASRWGIRGREDVGDGLAVIFQLEAGFDLDTGSGKTFSGNPSTATPTAPNGTPGTGGFNRRSFVGIQGRLGTLALGRDYTPVYYAGLEGDIMRYGLLGNLQAAVPLSGSSERWARISNGIFYTSPQLAGFTGRAAYSLGSEGAGGPGNLPKRANHFLGLGGQYTLQGLTLTASYQELNYPLVAGTPAAFTGATAKHKDIMVAGRYASDGFAVSGGYLKVDQLQDGSDVWLGASVDIGLGTLYAQVQRLRQDNAAGAERKGTVFGLGCVYSLSKRTGLYASYGQVSNSATASFALVSSDTSIAAGASGADPKALSIGMRHNF